MKILEKGFYLKKSSILAKDLLGKILIKKVNDKLLGGIIVETEAYSQDDPSAHTFKGKTERNKSMFLEGGHSYIYRIYGTHFCFDIVSGEKDVGDGVLIRALEPIYNIDIMKENRKTNNIYNIANGPAKLCKALSIDMKDNSICLYNSDNLYVIDNVVNKDIITTTRIGISKAIDLPLRFYLKNNKFISKK